MEALWYTVQGPLRYVYNLVVISRLLLCVRAYGMPYNRQKEATKIYWQIGSENLPSSVSVLLRWCEMTADRSKETAFQEPWGECILLAKNAYFCHFQDVLGSFIVILGSPPRLQSEKFKNIPSQIGNVRWKFKICAVCAVTQTTAKSLVPTRSQPWWIARRYNFYVDLAFSSLLVKNIWSFTGYLKSYFARSSRNSNSMQ